MTNPTAIAFEGGGVRIVCMQGVVRALEEHDMRKDITRVIGTSAGALAALLFALGSPANTMRDVMEHMDFTMLNRDDNMVTDIERLCTKWGAHDGNRLRRLVTIFLNDLHLSPQMTLADVQRYSGIELVITTTHLESRKTVYLTAQTHPHMPAAVAVRMSMSIPFYFSPFVAAHAEDDHHNNWGLEAGTYVDGGLLDDLPVAYFDPAKTVICTIETDGGREPETGHGTTIDSLTAFAQRVSDVAWSGLGRISLGPTASWVVRVPVSDVGMTEFDLSKTKKHMLMKRGYDCAQRCFFSHKAKTERKMPHALFSWSRGWLGQ